MDTKLKESNEQNLDILATKEGIANSKAEMIKWMPIFWIGPIGVLPGIMAFSLNAYTRH